MANDNKKFPAGIEVPVICGWHFQVFSRFKHFLLQHVVETCTMVPNSLTLAKGLGTLHWGQTLNNNSSCDKKMTNFGSVLRTVYHCSKSSTLKCLEPVPDLGFFKHYSQTFQAIFPVKYIAAMVFREGLTRCMFL